MYTEYFALDELPFSITPDPRFVYMSNRHREALAHLQYSLSGQNGFVLLTGEVGTGKTTLCRCILESTPEELDVALILNPALDARELVASVCDELGIEYDHDADGVRPIYRALNEHLLKRHLEGRRVVLIIDEAQNLGADVLEQIRLLTNLETTKQKLLQIVLIGQPELRTLVAQQNLRQLAQRITARYHLMPLDATETAAYVKHRLAVCGAAGELFTARALRRVHERSDGIPRLVNTICDRALLGAYATGKAVVTPGIVENAANEVLNRKAPRRWVNPVVGAIGAGAAVSVAAMVVTGGLDVSRLAHLVSDAAPPPTVAGPESARPVAPVAIAETTVRATSPGDASPRATAGTREAASAPLAAGSSAVTDSAENAAAADASAVAAAPSTPVPPDEQAPSPSSGTPAAAAVVAASALVATSAAPVEAAVEDVTAALAPADGESLPAVLATAEVASDATPGEPTLDESALALAPLGETASAPPDPSLEVGADGAGDANGVETGAAAPPPGGEATSSSTPTPPPSTASEPSAPVEAARVEQAPTPAGAAESVEATASAATGTEAATVPEASGQDPTPAPVPGSAGAVGALLVGARPAADGLLFRRWGLDPASLPGTDACERAQWANLRCHVGSTSWDDLVAHDRPAVLVLPGTDELPDAFAVLVGVAGDEATLMTDAGLGRMPVARLRGLWKGDYLLLWRPPPGFPDSHVARGETGRHVAWLRRSLGQAMGVETGTDAATQARFDDSLVELVRRFQAARGLAVDGVVGKQTTIAINNVVQAGRVPRLTP